MPQATEHPAPPLIIGMHARLLLAFELMFRERNDEILKDGHDELTLCRLRRVDRGLQLPCVRFCRLSKQM